ncbi:HAD family hydrolase [Meridianimarinicoccus roseus]|uniref:HAD family hydrolase n=1 Tax=Meridianimarinicoccus roseus TaxID=2072018 RepID=A0A2V2LH48_9RHOB|nr:HAD family hydrolase [Meridianimarinicoccus roseus]PWR02477.1 HAD family hydrolase [Meridianimarinicoccus roseus]
MTLTRTAPPHTAIAAFARYHAIAARLPAPPAFPERSRHGATLADTMETYDAYVLDAYGVLVVGEAPVPGAVARIAQLRAGGKAVCVLTNAASYPRARALEKYRGLGFDFAAHEVVSSRDVAGAQMEAIAPGALWAAIAVDGDDFSDLPARVEHLLADDRLWHEAEAFVFLASDRWTGALQDRLVAALERRPRPLLIANPDLVAPQIDGLSIEPGWFAHDLWDRTGQAPVFHGKPFGTAYSAVAQRIDVARAAMVGDTLHTDILGGAAAGLGTVLVGGLGLFAGHDVQPFIDRSRIVPDWVIPTT